MLASSTRRIAISPEPLLFPEDGGEFEPLLPGESLRAAARDELRTLYDSIGGEVLDLSDID